MLIGFVGLESESAATGKCIFVVPHKNFFLNPLPNQFSVRSVDLEILSEYFLAQHMFSAFMWAIAEHVSDHLIQDGETTVENRDPFRSDQALLTSKLENAMLRQTANALQNIGLVRTAHEAYVCIIPALSCASKLPNESIVD